MPLFTRVSVYGLLMIATLASNIVTSQVHAVGEIVLGNSFMRFGNGGQGAPTYTVTESSILPTTGMFRQPFYRDTISNLWYKLTYASYPLNFAVGLG
jgi:hypothetical protein